MSKFAASCVEFVLLEFLFPSMSGDICQALPVSISLSAESGIVDRAVVG